MRSLSNNEQMLIAHLAEKLDGHERAQLLEDAAHATADLAAKDGSKIIFEIADYRRPNYCGQHPFSAEGKMFDSDDAELSVLLHADENGRLLELEFIRWDLNDVRSPQWNTLQVF